MEALIVTAIVIGVLGAIGFGVSKIVGNPFQVLSRLKLRQNDVYEVARTAKDLHSAIILSPTDSSTLSWQEWAGTNLLKKGHKIYKTDLNLAIENYDLSLMFYPDNVEAHYWRGVAYSRLKELDVAEISAEYSYQELLWYEGLGFCDRGEGGNLMDSGITEMSGKLPVNPSGGVMAGNPMQVAGTARVAEATLQLRSEAGDRQVENVKNALAHGFYGPCGQSQCILILGN